MGSSVNPGASSEPIRVFVSYARNDKKWLDLEFQHALIPFLEQSLKRENAAFWYDIQGLKGGDEWRRIIESEIDRAQVAVLLVTQNFLNSDFIQEVEMPRIDGRAKSGKMVIVPVLVEQCRWKDYPVVADRQMVPAGKPLVEFTRSEPDFLGARFGILDDLVNQVRRIRTEQEQARRQREREDAAREKTRLEAATRAEAAAREKSRKEAAERLNREAEAARGNGAQRKAQQGAPSGSKSQTPRGSQPRHSTETKPTEDPLTPKEKVLAWAFVVVLLSLVGAVLFFGIREGIYQLGVWDVSDHDFDDAAPHFARACTMGRMGGCDYLLNTPSAVPKDHQIAAASYRKVCDSGVFKGCVRLALLYESGEGVSKDAQEANALFQKACNGGERSGCDIPDDLFEGGIVDENSKDFTAAALLYKRACELGNAQSCTRLGDLYFNGSGVSKNFETMAALFRKACDGGDPAGCEDLGNSYWSGYGVSKNPQEAASFYKKACAANYLRGCRNLGRLYELGNGVSKDLRLAESLYEQACKGNDPSGCDNLGSMYKDGVGVGQDLRTAKQYYQQGCTLGLQKACESLNDAKFK